MNYVEGILSSRITTRCNGLGIGRAPQDEMDPPPAVIGNLLACCG